MKRCGIIGGTFNPIHWGHLRIAEVARERLGLNKVIFIPSASPPHKRQANIIDAKKRYDMCLLATHAHPDFMVSRIEMERTGPSYTYDTIQRLKQDFTQDVQLFFIVGADMLCDLVNWYKAVELLQSCSFAAIARAGFNLNSVLQDSPFLQSYQEKLHLLEIPPLNISSTMIRKKQAQGLSIRYLVPEDVWHYIIKHQLYLEEEGERHASR